MVFFQAQTYPLGQACWKLANIYQGLTCKKGPADYNLHTSLLYRLVWRFEMEVYDTVRTVLAVRAFQNKSVPPEVIRRIVESAWLTASSRNGQPWHFIVVEDRSMLEKLGQAVRTGPYIAQAAFAVAVGMEKSVYAVSDVSRAIQSMILTAWSEGVGSNWTGFGGMTEVGRLLGVPSEIEIMAVVPFGYPVRKIGKGRKNRKPFSQVVQRGRFGRPFE
jgi:nitroreductase